MTKKGFFVRRVTKHDVHFGESEPLDFKDYPETFKTEDEAQNWGDKKFSMKTEWAILPESERYHPKKLKKVS